MFPDNIDDIDNIIKLKNNVYFLNISKNGCSFLKNVSSIINNKPICFNDVNKLHIQFTKTNLDSIILLDETFTKKDIFVFAVWRNPIDRFISLYKDIKYGHLANYFYFKNRINSMQDLITIIEANLNSPSTVDRHFRKQIDYLNNIEIDLIVKLEDLDDYIKYITNNEKKFQHVNSFQHIKLEENIPNEIIDKLKTLYQEDFLILETFKEKLWNKNSL